jgi:hypothetical protein
MTESLLSNSDTVTLDRRQRQPCTLLGDWHHRLAMLTESIGNDPERSTIHHGLKLFVCEKDVASPSTASDALNCWPDWVTKAVDWLAVFPVATLTPSEMTFMSGRLDHTGLTSLFSFWHAGQTGAPTCGHDVYLTAGARLCTPYTQQANRTFPNQCTQCSWNARVWNQPNQTTKWKVVSWEIFE